MKAKKNEKRGEGMRTLKSELLRLGFKSNNNHKGNIKSKKEQFTHKELADLMGTNRAIYKRGKGGAFRQR